MIEKMENGIITINIPLTKATEKIRIKKRSILNEYGLPVASKKEPFNQSCYVEWQIGYDAVLSDIEKSGKIVHYPDLTFIGANGKNKTLFELSEIIKYFYDFGVIEKNQLEDINIYLKSLTENDFLDNSISHDELAIKRSQWSPKNINGFEFLWTRIEYPLLVYHFNNYEIIAEVVIKEKQHAIGTQPMLYFCFPITELKNSADLLGRTANVNEKGTFEIHKNNISVFVNMLKLFGTLSESHNYDVIQIINTIL